ncbi:MAG: hydroxymethylglutaryl-CoA reductase [Candidatus Promineifilaceae bacterium]
MVIPDAILKQLYTRNSLRHTANGLQFALKNRLADAMVHGLAHLEINGAAVPLDQITVESSSESHLASQISAETPLPFPLRQVLTVHVPQEIQAGQTVQLNIEVLSDPFGPLNIKVTDDVISTEVDQDRIPRNDQDDYNDEIIAARRRYVEKFTNSSLKRVSNHSIDPQTVRGNIEHFIGTAQVPIGIVGPLQVKGEHAEGEFLIPLATSEGTLVASYSRGIKALNAAGGALVTISDDVMQRAPVFVFANARDARDFIRWIDHQILPIRAAAEATSSIAQLQYIDCFHANKFAYLRFNFTTGDAAGQNMVSKATFAACEWILSHYPSAEIKNFYLESNFATDKKASQINTLRTRGKRVTAEIEIPREIVTEQLHTTPERLIAHYGVANIGALMSGANNNGLHAANGLAAVFIATGQDAANVAECSSGLTFAEILPNGDLYMSVTLPSLIVATYGGGTSLATQRECLELMDCYGPGRVHKFAEIVSALVLAGDLSLAAAISSADWVSSHERLGRNR